MTVENFRTWWEKFLPAHLEKPQWPVPDGNTPSTPKLTGKQLFERGALLELEGLTLTASPSPLATSSSITNSSSSITNSSSSIVPDTGASAGAAPQDLSLFEDVGDLPDDLDD